MYLRKPFKSEFLVLPKLLAKEIHEHTIKMVDALVYLLLPLAKGSHQALFLYYTFKDLNIFHVVMTCLNYLRRYIFPNSHILL